MAKRLDRRNSSTDSKQAEGKGGEEQQRDDVDADGVQNIHIDINGQTEGKSREKGNITIESNRI